MGSGTGELLRLVRAHYPFRSFGCDYTDKLLTVPGAEIHRRSESRTASLHDNRFALITCIETVEHLENFRVVERNAWAVRAMNSPDLLLGRTLIVTAVKPA